MTKPIRYYVHRPNFWPIIGALGLFLMMLGFGNWVHQEEFGPYLAVSGICFIIIMLVGWSRELFSENIREGDIAQVDKSYRWGMIWFIFSEVCFFSAFFFALFYTRDISVPVLGGEAYSPLTNNLLWPHFKATWPLLVNPNPAEFKGATEVVYTWGLPALNTFILLSSGAALTWALHALKQQKSKQVIIGIIITILLGSLFLCIQITEYTEAYTKFHLTLSSGIYGSTFFMLTGFHSIHVTAGLIFLMVTLYRCIRKNLTTQSHFGFEAAVWYWHFVDVVWLFLFVFVYWL